MYRGRQTDRQADW